MAVFEIPLTPQPQVMTIALSGVVYTLRFSYANSADDGGGWLLDIGDAVNNPLVCGVPLVSAVNLLEQYEYLAMNGTLFALSDRGLAYNPTFADLGVGSHVYWEPTS